MRVSLPHPLARLGPWILLLVMLAFGLWWTRPDSYRIHWNDEALYFTVASNIAQNFDFNSHHYVSESILLKGYPTKDTHPPGFPLLLALFLRFTGFQEKTGFWVNGLAMAASLGLVYYLGKSLDHAKTGLLAAFWFLIYSVNLPMTQSVMSEPVATLSVLILTCVLFLKKEGIVKGVLLALIGTWALLIKPFLAVFLPLSAAMLWLQRDPGWRRTLTGLGLSLTILVPCVLVPLLSHREYYPYAMSEIALQAGWKGKVQVTAANLKRNYDLIVAKKGNPGEWYSTLAMLLLFAIPLVSWAERRWRKTAESLETNVSPMDRVLLFTTASFLLILTALFLFYEYFGFRGVRALSCFSPLLALLTAQAFFYWLSRAKGRTAWVSRSLLVVSIAGITLLLWHSLHLIIPEIRGFQRVQFNMMQNNFARLKRALVQGGLVPHRVVAAKNFYFPIAYFPSEVLWSLPKSLQELEAIDRITPLDVVEIRKRDPLAVENRRITGTEERLGTRFQLFHKESDYLYYRKISPSEPSLGNAPERR